MKRTIKATSSMSGHTRRVMGSHKYVASPTKSIDNANHQPQALLFHNPQQEMITITATRPRIARTRMSKPPTSPVLLDQTRRYAAVRDTPAILSMAAVVVTNQGRCIVTKTSVALDCSGPRNHKTLCRSCVRTNQLSPGALTVVAKQSGVRETHRTSPA